MKRHRTLCVALSIGGFGLAGSPETRAQVTSPAAQVQAGGVARPSGIEVALLRSLQANPITAPYPFATEIRGRQVVLRGRVGTKQTHDVAIQTAIALGVPVVDDLVIDTAAAHQAVAYQTQAGVGPGMAGQGYGGPAGYGSRFPGAGAYGPVPYTYPQPILGRLDDPFYGFEPPAIGYPPWWGALTARRLGSPAYGMPPGGAANNPPAVVDPSNSAASAQPADPAQSQSASLPYGTIDMAIDPRGVATLRGTVPSLAERIAIGQRVAQTQGVAQVINLLNIQAMPAASSSSDTPPPPPVPATTTQVPRAASPLMGQAEGPPIAVDSDPASQRAARSIASRSGLAGLPIRVRVKDGVASLSGKVPTIYEAMLAYRAIQQTPGIREVEDRLEFVVPDGSGPNPLVEKGRPEDVEPYLEAQIRRQVGDLAHVDRVRVQGNALDIRGTLGREEDRDRFDAILRSLPILRGFRLTAEVTVETR